MTPPSQAVDRSERTLELARMYRARRALVQQHLRGFGVPEAALEDALHDVFMIAFRRLAVFDTRRGSMRAWLVGIAWRVAAAHRRRREHVALPCDEDVASDLPDPEAYAARSEAAVVLDRLLNSLPPEQAAAFVLAELEGLHCREIAEQWNIAPATAYTRVARARVKLRAELERARQGRRPWWAVLFLPARGSSGFCEDVLEQQNLAIVPGSAFGSDEYVRFSYATSIPVIERALERFGAFLAAHPRGRQAVRKP